ERDGALEGAHQREPHGRAAHRIFVTGDNAVDQQLDRKIAGIRDDGGTDGKRLGKPSLVGERGAGRLLETAHDGGGRSQHVVYRAHDRLSLIEGQVIYAHVDHGDGSPTRTSTTLRTSPSSRLRHVRESEVSP